MFLYFKSEDFTDSIFFIPFAERQLLNIYMKKRSMQKFLKFYRYRSGIFHQKKF